MNFVVEITEEAQNDLTTITDVSIRRVIAAGLLRLETEPAKRGKALRGDLEGYYSVRLARQRYRAVYSIAVSAGVVTVVVVGIRKDGDKRDAYRIAKKRAV